MTEPTHVWYLYCLNCGWEQRQPSSRCVKCGGIDFRTIPLSFACGHDLSNGDCCFRVCHVRERRESKR